MAFHTVASVARASSTYRRWVIATTLGELAAFSVPTVVWRLAATAGIGDTATYLPVVFAGAGEGAVLGYAQSRVLCRVLPALDPRAWVRVTAAAGRWIAANALAWLAGLPVVFVAFAVAPDGPAATRAALAVAGGLGMGFTVAVVTGLALVRLLRSLRSSPPQPLRRRAAIHLNHAHAWLYERTGGRAGGRIGGHPVLLLTTTGRRSGLARRTPVQYERLDGDPILVAAANGAPEPSAWWRNLDADSDVIVQIADHVWHARAVTVEGEEWRQLWPRMCAFNWYLEPLQRKAGRELPLVRLLDLVRR